MAKRRIEQLSIYLIKPSFAAWQDCLREGISTEEILLPDDMSHVMALVVRPSNVHLPKWIRFFPESTRGYLQHLIAASAGSVLFVKSTGRLFAVCFGTGWHLLRRDSYVRAFGLRSALALVKPGTLVSADISSYDNFAKHSKISTSRGTAISSFDLSEQLDLLRGVIGECEFKAVGERIGGRDPLVLWTYSPIDQLPKLCKALFRSYRSSRTSRRYPILDKVSLVTDPTEEQIISEAFCSSLQLEGNLDPSLAPPEAVDWEECANFNWKQLGKASSTLVLDFQTVRAYVGNLDFTIEIFKSLEIQTEKADGTPGRQLWNVWDCIVTEFDHPQDLGTKCVRLAGDWYKVEKNLVDSINHFTSSIPSCQFQHMPKAKCKQTEGRYNIEAADAKPSILQCLDSDSISYGGGASKVELCDIISNTCQLYCIKDFHGSATLSHLFAQGAVAARLLLEQDFRILVRNKFSGIAKSVIPETGFEPAKFEIVYAIICEPTRDIPGGLPFFSKVRLTSAVKELYKLGFKNISTLKIEREPNPELIIS